MTANRDVQRRARSAWDEAKAAGLDMSLILAKEAMGRPQDHLAVLQLRAIRERRKA